MVDKKALFLNKDLRCGGFYELSIQVCSAEEVKPIIDYTNYIWTLENVEGPYDINFYKTEIDVEGWQHQGLLELSESVIPFKTYYIHEESDEEQNYNWINISIYTATIEHVLGKEYQTWTENPNYPKILDDFFEQTLKHLYKTYPFKLAMIGFEISGMYNLDTLTKPLQGATYGRFYLGKENFERVHTANREHVSIVY